MIVCRRCDRGTRDALSSVPDAKRSGLVTHTAQGYHWLEDRQHFAIGGLSR